MLLQKSLLKDSPINTMYKWRFIRKNRDQKAIIGESVISPHTIFNVDTIMMIRIYETKWYAYNKFEYVYLSAKFHQNERHHTPHVLSFVPELHDFGKECEYDSQLYKWSLKFDNHAKKYYASGYRIDDKRIWETSNIEHILFFIDSITVVTQNKHFYTLYYKDLKYDILEIKI